MNGVVVPNPKKAYISSHTHNMAIDNWRQHLLYNDMAAEPKILYRVAQKLAHFFVRLNFIYALTSSYIDRFSNLFQCLNQENICNNTVTEDPDTPQVCRYTTL